jgi:hypothetical protein
MLSRSAEPISYAADMNLLRKRNAGHSLDFAQLQSCKKALAGMLPHMTQATHQIRHNTILPEYPCSGKVIELEKFSTEHIRVAICSGCGTRKITTREMLVQADRKEQVLRLVQDQALEEHTNFPKFPEPCWAGIGKACCDAASSQKLINPRFMLMTILAMCTTLFGQVPEPNLCQCEGNDSAPSIAACTAIIQSGKSNRRIS